MRGFHENRGTREKDLNIFEIDTRNKLKIGTIVIFTDEDGDIVKGDVRKIGVTICRVRVITDTTISIHSVRYAFIRIESDGQGS